MDKQLRPVWRSKVCIKVSTDSTATDIMNAALLKKSQHDQHFNRQLNYVLVYKDGSPVELLPESREPFSLKKYKEELMIDYAKIIFYITNAGCVRFSVVDN